MTVILQGLLTTFNFLYPFPLPRGPMTRFIGREGQFDKLDLNLNFRLEIARLNCTSI